MPWVVDSTCFFFFQAEDGIRDDLVTGVQTCALPICHAQGHRGDGAKVPALPGGLGELEGGAGAWAGRFAGFQERAGSGEFSGGFSAGDRERGVEGKRVDLGGRRIIKKKKKREKEWAA